MEESIWCPSCKAKTAHFDLVDCTTVCERCGCVQDESPLVSGEHGGGQRVDDATGAAAAWRLLDRSRAGHFIQQQAFRQHSAGRPQAMRRVSDISDRVQLPSLYRTDVEALLDQVLQGEWGQGRWLDILVAACAYIVIRQNRLALTIADVASAVQSTPVELGATYRKVLQLLELQPPPADPMAFIRSAVSRIDGLQGRHVAKRAAVLEQSELLLKCASRACLLTGRRPLPLAAAALFQAAEANQVKLTLDRVCSTLGAAVTTATLRLRELRVALVVEGQKLPWGADITESSVKDHLPMILQLLRFSGEAEKQDQSAAPGGGSLGGQTRNEAARGALQRLGTAPSSSDPTLSENAHQSPGRRMLSGLLNGGPGQRNSESDGGGRKGRGNGKGGKNAQGASDRPQTPDGMASGPLGSYLRERKAREPPLDDPGSTTGAGGTLPGRGRSSGLSHRSPVGDAPGQDRGDELLERDCKNNLVEAVDEAGLSPRVGADAFFGGALVNRENQSAVSSGDVRNAGTPGTPEQSGRVPTAASCRAGIVVHSQSERLDEECMNGGAYLEGKSQRGPACNDSRSDPDAIGMQNTQTVSMPSGEAKPGKFDTRTKSQVVVVGTGDGERQLVAAGEVNYRVSGSDLGVLGDNKSSTSGEASPEQEGWSALPPSFRAQAIERQRRAALIADVKQRLAGVQTLLGVDPSQGSNLGPSMSPLPKGLRQRSERVLLTPKRKRNAVADPGWEARVVEALLIRGADERLLIEGQYEQARRQLDAARPRPADEDDDVTEYIRSEKEVRLLQAAERFVAGASKQTRRP